MSLMSSGVIHELKVLMRQSDQAGAQLATMLATHAATMSACLPLINTCIGRQTTATESAPVDF